MNFKTKQLSLLYKWLMSILAIISILMIVLDYAKMISINKDPYMMVDKLILILFTIDYLIRLILSVNKIEFVKSHIFDLLSIIQVAEFFTFFRITRLARLARLLRLVRLVGLTGRLKDFVKTNGLIYYFYLSLAVLLIAACLYSISEKVTFSNALWWSITTATTVGYGDISPTTPLGRFAAILIMFFGIGFVGLLTSSITNFFNNQQTDDWDEKLQAIRLNLVVKLVQLTYHSLTTLKIYFRFSIEN